MNEEIIPGDLVEFIDNDENKRYLNGAYFDKLFLVLKCGCPARREDAGWVLIRVLDFQTRKIYAFYKYRLKKLS